MNGPGFFITPISGGAVPIAVGLIHAFEALRVPVAVYDASLRFQLASGDRANGPADVLPVLRQELVDVLPRVMPRWILAIDAAPLDAETCLRLRARLPGVRIAHWLVEAHETIPWWTNVGPGDDIFFSAEGGGFEKEARNAGIPFHWLPTGCDDTVFKPRSAAARSGIAWAGTLRPDRAAFFERLASSGLPLRLAGRGLSDHAALLPHAVHDGWVDAALEADLYASSLVVPEFHAGAGHDIVGPRIFAAAGCGALVVSTHRERLHDLYPGDLVEVVDKDGDWAAPLARLLEDPSTAERGARAAAWTAGHHTYRHRARVIVEALTRR